MIFGGMIPIHVFPFYQTREQYQQLTGRTAPTYDPRKDIKSWEDPDAATSVRLKVAYPRVIALAEDGRTPLLENGRPYLEAMILPRDQAARVNIPPKGPGILDQPVTGREVPMPCRELMPTEKLILSFMGLPKVVDTLTEPPTTEEKLDSILAALGRIELKLEVKS